MTGQPDLQRRESPAQEVEPVIRGIIRRKLRVTLDPADGRRENQLDREIIESHVELCARCAAELGDLAAFAQRLSAETEPGPMGSQRLGLGAISLPRKVKIRAGEDEETKER
jgi:hypothetical protein